MNREIEFVTIDIDALDLPEDERRLLESCLPDEEVNLSLLLTDERIDTIKVAAGLVTVN